MTATCLVLAGLLGLARAFELDKRLEHASFGAVELVIVGARVYVVPGVGLGQVRRHCAGDGGRRLLGFEVAVRRRQSVGD